MTAERQTPRVAIDQAISLFYAASIGMAIEGDEEIIRIMDDDPKGVKMLEQIEVALEEAENIKEDIRIEMSRGRGGRGGRSDHRESRFSRGGGRRDSRGGRSMSRGREEPRLRGADDLAVGGRSSMRAGSSAPAGRGRGRGQDQAEPSGPMAARLRSQRGTVEPFEPPVEETRAPRREPEMEPEEDFEPVSSKEQIIFDPHAFVPKGVEIDPERPWDVIYAPGRVEVRPAFLTDWKRTVNDLHPYAQGYEPDKFCLFYIKWPDDMVEEHLIEWGKHVEMDYLKHELNAKLRQENTPSDGKVVDRSRTLQEYKGTAKPIAEVVPKTDEPVDLQNITPVVLDAIYSGSTDLENEEEALQEVIAQLKLGDTDPVPAHEYYSVRVYPVSIPETTAKKINELCDQPTLLSFCEGIVKLRNEGELPQRYYRMFDEHLTKAFNLALKDNMGLPNIQMDSFFGDFPSCYEFLHSKGMYQACAKIQENELAFRRRCFNFRQEVEVDENDVETTHYCLIEENINVQLSWHSSQLASLNMEDEPVLLSGVTHPTVARAVLDVLNRNIYKKSPEEQARNVRLITSDGVYMDVIPGWWQKESILLRYSVK
jgi:hypothetical protein